MRSLLCAGGRGVRIVELSNHPGVRLKETRQRRAHAEKHVRSQFEEARDQHLERVKAARDSRDQARAQHRWWAWLRFAVAARREQRQAPAPPATATGASDQEEILRAGIAGEQLVATGLGQVLSDDWTLLRGYRNKRGEIDHLLLGPQGLVAIEGKHLNATVHCVGDTWRFCKYDRYGNLVERGTLTDWGGRSPSVQLNEPARLLERFLRSRGQHIPIQRVVLLTHPRSKVGNCSDLTVHIATSTDYVVGLLNESPQAFDAGQLVDIEQLIERDHRFHETRHSP
jgi:hypothetical protein